MSSILDGVVKTFRTILVGGNGSTTAYVVQSRERSPPAPVTNLTVYTSNGTDPGSHITRLDCGFSDSSTNVAGSGEDFLASFAFQAGEVIEQCVLYLLGGDTGRVAMSFTTNLGLAFQAGDTSQTGTQVAIRGGRLFGFYGVHGEVIDQIGLIMEIPVTALEVSDLVYETTGISPTIMGPVALDAVTLSNYSATSQMAGMTRSYTVTTSSVWWFNAGLRPGLEITVEAGMPLVSGGTIGSSAETSLAYIYGRPHKRSQVFQYTVQVEVPAMSQITAEVTATQATLSVGYTATLKVCYADGSTATLPVEGTYSGTAYYDVAVTYGPPTPGDEIVARRAQNIAASLSLYGKRPLDSLPARSLPGQRSDSQGVRSVTVAVTAAAISVSPALVAIGGDGAALTDTFGA